MKLKSIKRLKLFGHSIAGIAILTGVGAMAALAFTGDSLLGRVSELVIAAQVMLILGALNLYILVKTPVRDVVSENADALSELEHSWRTGTMTRVEAEYAKAATIEATGRIIALMVFAAIATVGVLGVVL